MNLEEYYFIFEKGNFEIKERIFENFVNPDVCYNKRICYCCGTKLINYLVDYPYKIELKSFLNQFLTEREIKDLFAELEQKQKVVVKRIF